MESRSQKTWKTLRKISSSQEESEGTVPANEEEIVRTEPSACRADAVVGEEKPETFDGAGKSGDSIKVLVAHPVSSTSRLIRETLESFTELEVETTSNFLRAFELALQKRYEMFFFGMSIGDLDGSLLYEMISKVYACGKSVRKLAPAVVFIREKDEKISEELERDVRVKDVVSKPIRIERLLKAVESIVEVKDPTTR
ncbi:MAG: hypothetical protein CMO61_04090 [Verrucomicrobiales bacterium]|jgi:CheY-like chemotaxis protein|nr:hypothetical protein [Verrucomicrobiales bacterium]|tara:strand:- start:7791 stop:8384 length:594 start_codon:yes stop_codon:yes gene_type:complete